MKKTLTNYNVGGIAVAGNKANYRQTKTCLKVTRKPLYH
jgi:hypothetical protein